MRKRNKERLEDAVEGTVGATFAYWAHTGIGIAVPKANVWLGVGKSHPVVQCVVVAGLTCYSGYKLVKAYKGTDYATD